MKLLIFFPLILMKHSCCPRKSRSACSN